MFRLKLGSQNMIVLNTVEDVDELLIKRSNKYSSRTPPHVASDIMSLGQRMVFMKYSPEYKVSDKLLHTMPSADQYVE